MFVDWNVGYQLPFRDVSICRETASVENGDITNQVQ